MLSGIYEAYAENFAKQQEEKEREQREKFSGHLSKKIVGGKSKQNQVQDQKEYKLLKAANFIDRIINLNVTDGIAQGNVKICRQIYRIEHYCFLVH